MNDIYIETNGVRLHTVHYPGDGPTLFLFHGLTANAHAFDGLIKAGLNKVASVYSFDLRGRGESDKADDYTMAAHAKDVLGVMEYLGIEKVIMGGHSFGALLSLYMAAHFPEHLEKIIILDGAAKMHPNTKEMLVPALSRLGREFESFDSYIDQVKAAPYITFWDEQMRSYYRADVKSTIGDAVIPVPELSHMTQAVNGALAEPWLDYLKLISLPALLINGPGIYTLDAALLPEENARETAALMKDCKYVKVEGNHQTMLYGKGAEQIVESIDQFIKTN